jgi:hypothetical protein
MKKRILGKGHPATIKNMENLASAYRNQKRLNKTEKLFIQVTETRRAVLKKQNPDTIKSISNLASVYQNQGR